MPNTNDDAALSYQFGEYAVLIWDSFNTNYKDALKSLASLLEPDTKVEPVPLLVTALSMENWEAQDYTTMILKSAARLSGYDDPSPREALYCLLHCVNYLANICRMSKADMNDGLHSINKQLITNGYKETEVED